MEYSIIDNKLEELIQACTKTKNYKKIAVVGLMLISNKTDEIGIKLGLKPRNKDDGELIYEYMKAINVFLETNLKFTLFEENLLNTTKRVEEDFKNNSEDISVKFVRPIFDVYYELRRVEVPNLYKSYNNLEMSRENNNLVYSILNSKFNVDKSDNTNKTKKLLMNRLESESKTLQSQLRRKYDKESFKKMLLLKSAQSSIEKEQDKTEYEGILANNLNYQSSKPLLLGYLFLSIFILFFLLTTVMIIQAMIVPAVSLTSSFLILVFSIPCIISLIIYWYNFRVK